MDENRYKVTPLQAVGLLLLALACVPAAVYVSGFTSFNIYQAVTLAFAIVSSYVGALLLGDKIDRRVLYSVYLVLSVELFLRATVYGRADFFEYVLYEADAGRVEWFFENKVNLSLFSTVRRYLALDLLSAKVVINLFGNLLILLPVPVFYALSARSSRLVCLRAFLLSVAVSLSAELLQLFFMCGSPDVDDLLLNSLGGLIGAVIAAGLVRLRYIQQRKSADYPATEEDF